MNAETLLNDERCWQAVLERDKNADGQFVFAVQTTGIFCRPSCRARHALRHNVRFYADASAAQAAGYRPCKRCQPDSPGREQQHIETITRACRWLEQETPVSLEQLAREVAVSPYHLHRLFKSVTGVTPKAWQQAWRARRLREALHQGTSVTGAVMNAGFSASNTYYRHADAALGMTAQQFRRGGERLTVRYALGACELGRCLVAESERGICAVLLADDDDSLLGELRQLFPQASQEISDEPFRQRVQAVLATVNGASPPESLPLDIRGTAFQQQVWQALQCIPAGETRSYRQVAEHIGKPNAVRAVASACAANTLAILIPCHRVVRQSGALSGYRWGEARKAQLLAREAAPEE